MYQQQNKISLYSMISDYIVGRVNYLKAYH
jgi:hypothetical protein